MLTTTHVECESCHARTLVIVPMNLLPRGSETKQLRSNTNEDGAQLSLLEALGVEGSPNPALVAFIEAFRNTAGICFNHEGEER